MLKNYLVVAVRGVRRHPFYAALNVAGLAVGIAACMLIILFVQDELSYDRMHEAAERMYRVVEERKGADGGTQDFVYTMGPLGPEMARSFPEVERSVRAISRWQAGRMLVQREDVRFYVDDQVFVEPSFFHLFDFPFVAGSRSGALDEPFEVVLSEEAAARFFGEEDPTGQTLTIEGPGAFTVTGVVRIPDNTHVRYGLFFSLATLLNYEGWRSFLADWTSNGVITYLRMTPEANAADVEARMRELVASRVDQDLASDRRPYLQAVTDIHLGSVGIEFDEHAGSRPVYLYLFGAVALMVVLIAAMNYMNMATARSLRRSREIGMRKVVGARRWQLVIQFLSESLLTTAIALAAALLLARAVLPLFNSVADKALTLSLTGPIALGALVLAIVVGLVAGAYPALYLSRYHPTSVLRGHDSAGPGRSQIRQGLVVAQFAMSIGLMIAALVVHDQLRYVQTKELGFDASQLAVIDINSGEVRSQADAVKQELAAVAGVQSVSVSNNVPGDWKVIPQVEAIAAGAEKLVTAHFLGIDDQFLETYDIELAEGRGFRGTAADSSSLLLNESAANLLGVRIGDLIRVPDESFSATVIGIVEDFHFRSLHDPIGPLMLAYAENPIDAIDYFTVRLDGVNVAGAVDAMRRVGEHFDPVHPFELNFLDQRLSDFYAREYRVRQIFGAAAALAILIACMGLFALAAYTAEQRTKEIGIRKALGATAASITALLTSDFAKMIAAAFVIATPLSYLLMRWWLEDFAYRTTIGVETVALAGAAALALAIATVCYQAIRAATADPVEALRYE